MLLAAPGAVAGPPTGEPFPAYPAIRDNVAFWTRVYAEWTLSQVVVHDLEHPALVYEVVSLPGPVEERYTDEQREFVDDLATAWRGRLEALARRVESGEALDDSDKALALTLTTTVGTDAIRDAAERVRTQRGLRERFRRGLEIGATYDAALRALFREAGVPEDLAYLPHVESSFQARAVSSAGAVGVWQFTRSAARRYMIVDSAIDERLDPVAAARGAAGYLKDAYDEFGSWPIALTSYNHGVAGMRRAVAQHGADYERIFLDYRGRSFGFASKNFYAEFLAARAIARDTGRYFPEGLRPEPALDLEGVRLERSATPAFLAAAYGVALDELARLNPGWTRRAVAQGRSLRAGVTVWLPPGTLARVDPAAGAPDAAAAPRRYVVRAGDTLSRVAATHGISVERLRQLNGIEPRSSLIRVGDTLVIEDPALLAGGAVHVVRPGDTLMAIAVHYGVRLADLLLHNRLTASATIYPGQVIRIP